MTLASTQNRREFDLDGASDTFSFPYYFKQSSHLAVYLIAADGITPTLLVLGSDYTVTGADDPAGGSVVLDDIPDNTIYSKLVILRKPPQSQGSDITADSDSPIAVTVEAALDLIVMMIQDLQDQIDRKIGAGVGSDPDSLPSYDDFKALRDQTVAAAAQVPVNYKVQTVVGNGATEIDFSEGGYVILNVTGNCVLSFTGWSEGEYIDRLTLDIRNTGNFTVDFPTGIYWIGGEVAVTPGNGKRDMVVLTTPDSGATIDAHVIGQNFVPTT